MDDSRARSVLDDERDRLTTIQADLRDEGPEARPADDPAEVTVVEQHPADDGLETHDRSRDLGLLEQVETELRDIEDALRRLDEGTYGVCEVCGKAIPDERLEAAPTTRFDIEHERARDAGPLGGSSSS